MKRPINTLNVTNSYRGGGEGILNINYEPTYQTVCIKKIRLFIVQKRYRQKYKGKMFGDD